MKRDFDLIRSLLLKMESLDIVEQLGVMLLKQHLGI